MSEEQSLSSERKSRETEKISTAGDSTEEFQTKSSELDLSSGEGDNGPKDKYNIVYLIILLHGVCRLMPWNMFITIAPSYYTFFKMAAKVCNGTVDGNECDGHFEYQETYLSANFMSFMTLGSQIPNLLLNFANIFIVVKGDLTKRLSISLLVVGAMTAFTMCFIYVDTWSWTTTFFVLTMISIVILNAANGIYQNSVFGLASDFPFKYTNAVIIGNNLCGTFVTILSIISSKITSNVENAAFTYFTLALLTIGVCFATFFYLKRKEFYIYNVQKAAIDRQNASSDNNKHTAREYFSTLSQGWVQFFNVWFIFFVTLCCFPGMMVNITSYSKGNEKIDDEFFLKKDDFRDIFCFLLFNVFAFLGSMIAGKVQFPSAKYLIIPVVLRGFFIPFFAFCKYLVDKRTWPVIFSNNWLYICMATIMSISNGYLSGLGMMYSRSVVDPSKQRLAGMMSAFFLVFGIVAGLAFTMAVAWFITA